MFDPVHDIEPDGMGSPACKERCAAVWDDPTFSDIVVTYGVVPRQALQSRGKRKRAREEGDDSDEGSALASSYIGRSGGRRRIKVNGTGDNASRAGAIETHRTGAGEDSGEDTDAGKQQGGDAWEPNSVRHLRLHAVVLMVHSSVLEARLRRWTSAERPVRLRMELDSEEEAAAFEDMLWCMYHGALPDEELMTPRRALQIMLAADKYDVDAAARHGVAWLASQRSFTWDEALALLGAPANVQVLFPSTVVDGALTVLLATLGDLEVAMNADAAFERLLSLPEAALVALLGNSQLAAAAESTVAAAAVVWAQRRGLRRVPDAVATCVRLVRLKPGFAASVTRFFPTWTPRVLALAAACAGSDAARAVVAQRGRGPAALHAAASATPRRASAVAAAEVSASLPLEELAQAFARAAQDGEVVTIPLQGSVAYAGYRWHVSVKASRCPDHAIGVYVNCDLGAEGRWRGARSGCVSYCASVRPPPPQQPGGGRVVRDIIGNVTGNVPGRWRAIQNLGNLTKAAWDASRFDDWVDSAGRLQFNVRVTLV